MTPLRATIRVEDDREILRVLEESLGPEVGSEFPKTRSRLQAGPDFLELGIEAEDLPSLRAALHSYLRWIRTASDTYRVGKKSTR